MTGSSLRARHLHPGAWWAWATALAVAASRTTNPAVLLLIVAVCGYVATARRPNTPWSRSYVVFLRIGLAALGVRVLLFALLGSGASSGHVLLRLPVVPTPHWMAGVRLGGPVTVEGLLASAYDGLRLATILVCVGTANALTSPRRLLKSLPSALHETGVAVSVALAFAPQSVAALGRMRSARRLRGHPDRGLRSLRGLALPVLEGALERSVDLAAAMDARGFGRRSGQAPASRRAVAALTTAGLVVVLASTYPLLSPGRAAALGVPTLAVGVLLSAAGFALGARRGGRTRYRPQPWSVAEWLVVAVGVAAAVTTWTAPSDELFPATSPLTWPTLPLAVVTGLLAALTAAWLSPPLPRPRGQAAGMRTRPVEVQP